MNTERAELVLSTIDQLGAASVKQLHEILKFDKYRTTCRVVQNLEKYLHVDRSRQKIVYLNKQGREFIGASREVKKSPLFEHMLLGNEVFIHYDCPYSWKREFAIEIEKKQELDLSFMKIEGVNVTNTKRIVCDAYFERNGYTYLIEIDNTRSMVDNKKKINRYLENWSGIRAKFQNPKLCIFTKSETRKKKFVEMLGKIPHEVFTFGEI